MEGLTGSLTDSLYDSLYHTPNHADTTHPHNHGRETDNNTVAHPPTGASRLTVLTSSHHDNTKGNIEQY